MKFGADLRWVENNFNFDFYNNGSFTFGQLAEYIYGKRAGGFCRRIFRQLLSVF